MVLYALLDKKSGVLDYFIGSCDEDAMRIGSVMMMSSRPIYEFADDFSIVRIQTLVSTRDTLGPVGEEVVVDCSELKRQLIERRKEQENAEG